VFDDGSAFDDGSTFDYLINSQQGGGMAVNPNNVLVGISTLYLAGYGQTTPGSPEPMVADTIAYGTAWGGAWQPIGATDSGVEFGVANTMVDQRIEEQSTPALVVVDTQEITIDFTLDEDLLANFLISVGQGSLVTQAATTLLIGKTTLSFSLNLNPYSVGFETVNTFLGPTGLQMFRRAYVPKMISGNAKVNVAMTRAKTKRMYATSLRAICPSSSILVVDQTAPHS
jgi:hypothetical protein